jgi:hypothetical protein
MIITKTPPTVRDAEDSQVAQQGTKVAKDVRVEDCGAPAAGALNGDEPTSKPVR